MPVPEGDGAPTGIDDAAPGQMDTEYQYSIFSTCGVQPRELDDFRMVAQLAHTESVKEGVKIHNHRVLASMPPFSDMRKEQVERQLRTIEY
eukprot:10425234-Ditylum_brightwellii.AAC.1